MAIIHEDLGQPAGQLFSEISEQSVAAASLGQVFTHADSQAIQNGLSHSYLPAFSSFTTQDSRTFCNNRQKSTRQYEETLDEKLPGSYMICSTIWVRQDVGEVSTYAAPIIGHSRHAWMHNMRVGVIRCVDSSTSQGARHQMKGLKSQLGQLSSPQDHFLGCCRYTKPGLGAQDSLWRSRYRGRMFENALPWMCTSCDILLEDWGHWGSWTVIFQAC